MRFPKLVMLVLIALCALVAAGCGGGPKDSQEKLSAACERQVEEIAEAKKASKIVTAKSSEEHEASEQLHECAGQAPIEAAATTSTNDSSNATADDEADAAKAAGDTSKDAGSDTTEPAADTLPAGFDADAARTLFASTCGGCHMLTDAKTTGNVGPNLDTIEDTAAEVEEQIKNGGGVMPAGLLTGDDATNVAAYVASVSPSPGA
ncbi:MAG: cytochrome c class [Thermoleophilia bacterium]|nr:cytochrome c class [Thermoleophilia bacterium]